MITQPLESFVPEAPDSDWDSARRRIVAHLAATVGATWSDHNVADPGITLAELSAYGVADLHYRAARPPGRAWPLESPAWLPDPERHWYATLPPDRLLLLAGTLAAPAPAGGTVADSLEPIVREAPSASAALAAVGSAPWDALVPIAVRSVVVALLRERWVRQVALEHTDVVAEAVAAQADGSGSPADRDAAAAVRLADALPLWPDELAALVRRERMRLTADVVAAALPAIRAGTGVGPGELAALGLDAAQAARLGAAQALPTAIAPEDLEDWHGATTVWPPHGIQALSCEPVTAADYADRARAHPEVGRAWAVPGVLAGAPGRPALGWDGLPVLAASSRPGAVTLVVERISGSTPVKHFLREVLARAIGSEVSQPHPTWRDDLDRLDPRRLVCDEVGITLLGSCPITLRGVLVTGVGVDRDATIAAARDRVGAFLAAGRPESRPAATELAVDGPWPPHPQPTRGWNPGEPIRFTEVVEALVADPAVLGVRELAMRVGAGPWLASSEGSVALDPDCVPTMAGDQCLRVELVLTGGCSDA